MKIKMWCLINKPKQQIIWLGGDYYEGYIIGFATKKALMAGINHVEHDEEIRKIEVEV